MDARRIDADQARCRAPFQIGQEVGIGADWIWMADLSSDVPGAVLALRQGLDVLLRLFAPFIPFATEEVWSWTHDRSVHLAEWPTSPVESKPTGLLALVSTALIGIRRAKTDAKASQKTAVASVTISGPAILELALRDLKDVGRITSINFVDSADITVTDVVLGEPDAVTIGVTAETEAKD